MPITVEEKHGSRRCSVSSNPWDERHYLVRGAVEEVEAIAAVDAYAPLWFDVYGNGLVLIPRESIDPEEAGNGLWEVAVRWGIIQPTNESVFSFDTGGGTQHIAHSRATVGSYAPPGKTAPNCKQLIGVTPDAVEGVDIAVRAYQWSETWYLPDAFVTDAYKGVLFNLTGKVNGATWRGFAQGEVLFLGAGGSKRGGGDWELNYKFAANPNETGLVVGDITGIAKKGWEYLWVRYVDAVDEAAQALTKRPAAVYVEKVYDYGDFSQLGI
ncbi:MAG TPA: hypothetical protein PKK06_05305 [Phycisphaerae bacterium]|nr:hypothetical protein [Phycisphaerae bacterium]HNU44826.1 hypothetical protein [Phycisphaerae bacterium]